MTRTEISTTSYRPLRFSAFIAFCLAATNIVHGQVLTFNQAKQQADSGDAFAQAVVATHYQLGWQTEKNPGLAVKYAMSSAKAGHPLGKFRLGALMRAGDGIQKNEEQGLELQGNSFNDLHKANDPYSLTSAGIIIFQGKIFKKPPDTAIRYRDAAALYKRAADMGYAPAQFNYAMCAEAGHGIGKSQEVFEKYLTLAASNSYPLALAHTANGSNNRETVIYPPRIDPDISNSELNEETKIYEPASSKGKSSQWISVTPPDSNSDIKVYIRTQYFGYPVKHGHQSPDPQITSNDGESSAPYAMSDSFNIQSIYNVSQYWINDLKNQIVVKPVLGLEQRNLLSITEYPISLEFKIFNGTKEDVYVEELNLNVERYMPVEKVIPTIDSSRFDYIKIHNLGWGTMKEWGGNMTLLSYDDDVIDKASLISNEHKKIEVKTMFKSEKAKTYISEARDLGAWILAEGGPSASAKSTRGFRHGEYGYLNLVKLSADVLLPKNKEGYVLRYPMSFKLSQGESKTFVISLNAEESANVVLKPELSISGQMFSCMKPILAEIEVAKPLPGYTPEKILEQQGNDHSPYGKMQQDYIKSIANNITDSRFIELHMLEERSQEEGSSNKAYSSLSALTSMLSRALASENNSKVGKSSSITPTSYSLGDLRCHSANSAKSVALHDISNHENSIIITAEKTGNVVNGDFSIYNKVNKTMLFKAPWYYDNYVGTLQSEIATSQTEAWIAWLVKDENQMTPHLYIFFPEFSENAFSLPLISDDKIARIGKSDDGHKLLIEKSDGVYAVDLRKSITRNLVSFLKSRGTTHPWPEDIDKLGRVRLWIPAFKEKTSIPHSTVITFSEIPNAKKDIQKLVWLSKSQLGVFAEKWEIWNLLSGMISDCTDQETLSCERNYKKIIPKRDAEYNLLGSIKSPSGSKIEIRSSQGIPPLFLDNINLKPDDGDNFGYDINRTINESAHGRNGIFAQTFAQSNDLKTVAFVDKQGSSIVLYDTTRNAILLRCYRSAHDKNVFSLCMDNGYFMSGNGKGDGILFSKGFTGVPISQLEAKYNRPDIVLKQLGASDAVIKDAERLRERFVRRSDFKSFDSATLIDIPVVEIKSALPSETSKESVLLKYEASNSTGPLEELKVFNNGALIHTMKLRGRNGERSRSFEGEIDVDLTSGDNLLQFVSVSEEGFTSGFAEKKIVCTSPPESKRSFIASVGLSEYKDQRFNLRFAAKDAMDMAKALAEQATVRGYKSNVLMLTNRDADGELVAKLRSFLSTAGPNDEVILYFAGHGLLDKNLEYHLARYDTKFDSTENMGVTFAELESLIDGIKPLRRTMLFDTCHSGEVEEEDKQQLFASASGETSTPSFGVQMRGVAAARGMKASGLEPVLRQSDFLQLEKLFPDSRRAKGANILTSSSGSEFSMESDVWNNGLFTYVFLNTLHDQYADSDKDGKLAFEEIASTVSDRVATLSGGRQRPITRGVNREVPSIIAVVKDGSHADKIMPSSTSTSSINGNQSNVISSDSSNTWKLYPPGQYPKGKLYQATSALPEFYNVSAEAAYIYGDFVVSASAPDRTVLRPVNPPGADMFKSINKRVVMEAVPGAPVLAEKSKIERSKERPLLIISTEKAPDGNLNVYVRDIIKP